MSDFHELEERFRLLADHVPDLISFHDLEGRFLFATPSSFRLLGITPAALIGHSVYEFVIPEDQAALRDAHRDILGRSGKAPVTYRARRGDGSIGWFETTASMTEPTASGERRIVSVTRDVTERRALEFRLMQSEKLEAIGRLAGGIAHDFNNLLTVMSGQAQLAMATVGPDSPIMQELDSIREAAERAAGLTAQLLTFGRRQMTRPTRIDLNAALLGLHSLMRRLLPADIAIDTALAEDLWPIEIDPAQLEQVVLNLVVNARDAMPSGGTMRITTANILAGDADTAVPGLDRADHVMLRVTDTGVGMDAETARRAFEPFFTANKEGGTGLGLATVYGIVEQAGGTCTLESHPGRGTSVSLYFRRASGSAAGVEGNVLQTQQPMHGTETVLLAEDDAGVRSFAQAVLERYGYRVIPAASGAEALELFNAIDRSIDLVVADVIMPQVRGPALVAAIRERSRRMPVLFITGYATEVLARNGVSAIVDAELLRKPFGPEALATRVRSLLDRTRSTSQ